MEQTWQTLAIFFLGIVVAIGGGVLKHLVDGIKALNAKVSMLCTSIAVSKEWREGHDRHHGEMHTIQTNERSKIWDAIDKIRDAK